MKILIHLGNHLIAEAISQLLIRNGYESVVANSNPKSNAFSPDTVMVDIQTLDQQFLARYPDAKVFLIDTGLEKERIIAALLSYKIHGVLSPHTELELFKKALTVVSQGQIWVDNSTVVAFLHDSGTLSKTGRIREHYAAREGDHRLCLPGVQQQRDCRCARPQQAHDKSSSQQDFQKTERDRPTQAHIPRAQ